MKVTFTDGTAFYFVVPSLSYYGNVIVEIKEKELNISFLIPVLKMLCNENVLVIIIVMPTYLYKVEHRL